MRRSQRDVYDARMEAALPARTDRRSRAIPVLCGCALAGAAVVVAMNDPAAPDSLFPGCAFRAATGLWCPGCGLTRGFHQLLTGHPLSAMSYNIFVPVVLVAVVASWWGWMRTSWGKAERVWPAWTRQWMATGMAVALVAYGVLRNVPWAPLRTLAP